MYFNYLIGYECQAQASWVSQACKAHATWVWIIKQYQKYQKCPPWLKKITQKIVWKNKNIEIPSQQGLNFFNQRAKW